jgi:hypothetical protein
MITYYLYSTINFIGESTEILIRSDGAQIPFSENNPDYIEYLEWLALGNTPEEWTNNGN